MNLLWKYFLFPIGLFTLFSIVSCQSKDTKIEDNAEIQAWDSQMTIISELLDSLSTSRDSLIDQTPELRPLQVDDNFEDFLYTYSVDSSLQYLRTSFPLPIYLGDSLTYCSREEWKLDSLLVKSPYYAFVLDNIDQDTLLTSENINEVKVSYYDANHKTCRRYYFKKEKGIWLLEALHYAPAHRFESSLSRLGTFVNFWMRFANDSLYQQQHIKRTLPYVTLDEQHNDSLIQGVIDSEQWPSFRPYLQSDHLVSLDYGQILSPNSRKKLVILKGSGSGFLLNLSFSLTFNNHWKLVRYEDVGI
ncbi:MAG: DUF4348 domain-containing protein [Bacteroidaceae bacterium]